jgi:hypothetical protein
MAPRSSIKTNPKFPSPFTFNKKHYEYSIRTAISPAVPSCYIVTQGSAGGSADLFFNRPSGNFCKVGLDINFASVESTCESELSWDAFDTVGRVDVLDEDNLVAGCRPLTRDNGRVGKKEFPDLEPY